MFTSLKAVIAAEIIFLNFIFSSIGNAMGQDKTETLMRSEHVEKSLGLSELDQEYSTGFTDLLEFVYGESFLSQGGIECVDLLFKGQDLTGKKVLDIGSGLGGVDFYLAETRKVDLIGIDRVSRLVDEANRRKAHRKLLGQLSFLQQKTESLLSQFENNSFDIVFSKESLMHVADKQSLLREILRVLRPGGRFIILDWTTDSKELGPSIAEMVKVDGLDLSMGITGEYQKFVNDLFKQVSFANLNSNYVRYTSENMDFIRSNQNEIKKRFGEDTYSYSLRSWTLQKKMFENREVNLTLMSGTKAE